MALPRLLFVAEAELHFGHNGFLRPRRWFCSSPSPTPSTSSKKLSKRAEAAKEKKTEAIKSFVDRYMLLNPGVFPKLKEVHGEVGGSWSILKEIVAEMRADMLPDPQNEFPSEATVIEENADSWKLDSLEKVPELLTQKSESDEDATVSETVNFSDNSGPNEAIQIEQSREDKKHVNYLVDIFRRNQPASRCLSVPQERPSNQRETSVEDSKRTRVTDILEKIIELSKDKTKNGSSETVASSILNRELRGFMHETLNVPSLFEGCAPSEHLNKTDVVNPKVQMDSSDVACTVLLSEESDADVAAFDYPKPQSNNEVDLSVKGLNLNGNPDEDTGSHTNRLLVKFLPKTAKANDVGLAFSDCGPIAKIHIVPSRRENRYNYAYVGFKTEEGLRKALGKADPAVCGADIVVETAFPSMRYSRVFNVEPISDKDFPVALLKNPTRTVMIQGMRDNISFHDLRQAVSNWGHVSAFAMGSSCSIIYVEFESEESKERALVEATVSVSGAKLSIFRVEHPKTTVVRISNVNPMGGPAKVRGICDSFGRVKRIVGRDIDTFDVHFKSSEWTNMVKILNRGQTQTRLNGLVVDLNQWVAQPATVVPAEVLQALWNEPEGRKHAHELIQLLCKRIQEKSIDTAPMLDLAREYYGDI